MKRWKPSHRTAIFPVMETLIPEGIEVRNLQEFRQVMSEDLEEGWGYAKDMEKVYTAFYSCPWLYGKGRYADEKAVVSDDHLSLTLVLDHGFVRFRFSTNESKAYISLVLDGLRIMHEEGWRLFLHDLERLAVTSHYAEG